MCVQASLLLPPDSNPRRTELSSDFGRTRITEYDSRRSQDSSKLTWKKRSVEPRSYPRELGVDRTRAAEHASVIRRVHRARCARVDAEARRSRAAHASSCCSPRCSHSSSADASTVGASATELRHALHIGNTDIGLLVARRPRSSPRSRACRSAFSPTGCRRTRTLGVAIVLWGVAMVWSATVPDFGQLLVTRLALGGVTAAAGPFVASLVGDYFARVERGRIYGYILAGELLGAGVGFAVTGDIAALSWRAAFVILALPAFVLAWLVWRLPEPARGGRGAAVARGAEPTPEAAAPGRRDAQRLAAERGIEPDPELVLSRAAAHRAHRGGALHPADQDERRPDRRERARLLLPGRRPDVRCRVRDAAVRHRPGAREPPPARGRRRRRGRRPRRRHDRRPVPAPRAPERPDPRQRGRGRSAAVPLRARDLHAPARRKRSATSSCRSRALGPEPAARRCAARHHGAVPLGTGRGVRTALRTLRRPSRRCSSASSPTTSSAADGTGCSGPSSSCSSRSPASAFFLFRALRTYPRDVATAAAAAKA